MTMDDANRILRQRLTAIYEEREAAGIAALVLEYITGKQRHERAAERDVLLSSEQEQQLEQIADRLLRNEPVQYILGEAWFFGLKLFVDPTVLIPRPETEELVQWILDDLKKTPTPADRNLKIMDIGTGSGCIAIALRKNLPLNIETWACDINDQVLTTARRNAGYHEALVDFVPLDFLDQHQRNQLPLLDIIVSNPPYIPLREKEQLQENVRNYEPGVALFVPDKEPLVFYRAIAEFGKEKLQPAGKIYVEIHEDLANPVVELFQQAGYKEIEVRKDFQGKERMVRGLRGESF